jgi:hypothetical protein
MTEALLPPLPAGHAPVRFWVLLAGATAAPIFWLGQLVLGYIVSAYACYGGDHPTSVPRSSPLLAILVTFDGLAIAAAFAGLVISFAAWRTTALHEDKLQRDGLGSAENRARFLALWGLLSSIWCLTAIFFVTIGTLTVPLCIN